MKILLSAFACDPQFGSDEEVGWRWAVEAARQGHQVCVLTRASHREAIEAELARSGTLPGLRFEYVDAPRVHALLARINRRNHLYYYLWQWLGLQRAQALLAQGERFDLVHHVTWVSFRQPSFLGTLGLPFVFGPVAGGDEIPPGYARRFSFRQRLMEGARRALNACVRFDPLMRQTFRSATRLYVTSPAHLRRLPAFARAKARVELAIASAPTPAGVRTSGGGQQRLLFVGRALGLKGMDYGLEAFARAQRQRPGLRLSVVGDGPELARWQAQAAALGVADAVQWLGWLPRAQVQDLYASHDALLCPSLRDSGGFVVLEALQAGLPVVCFALGGPGVMVDASVGAAVAAELDQDATIQRYAQALLEVLDRAATDPGLAAACQARAARYRWDALLQRIYGEFEARRVA